MFQLRIDTSYLHRVFGQKWLLSLSQLQKQNELTRILCTQRQTPTPWEQYMRLDLAALGSCAYVYVCVLLLLQFHHVGCQGSQLNLNFRYTFFSFCIVTSWWVSVYNPAFAYFLAYFSEFFLSSFLLHRALPLWYVLFCIFDLCSILGAMWVSFFRDFYS